MLCRGPEGAQGDVGRETQAGNPGGVPSLPPPQAAGAEQRGAGTSLRAVGAPALPGGALPQESSRPAAPRAVGKFPWQQGPGS